MSDKLEREIATKDIIEQAYEAARAILKRPFWIRKIVWLLLGGRAEYALIVMFYRLHAAGYSLELKASKDYIMSLEQRLMEIEDTLRQLYQNTKEAV